VADRAIANADRAEEETVKTAAALIDRSPDDALRIGLELFRRSKYPAAADVYRKILAVHPSSATTWQNLGSTLEVLKDWDPAAAAYRKSVQLDPLNAAVRKDAERFEKKFAERKP
jgi:Flp pilus assembly protein TadD